MCFPCLRTAWKYPLFRVVYVSTSQHFQPSLHDWAVSYRMKSDFKYINYIPTQVTCYMLLYFIFIHFRLSYNNTKAQVSFPTLLSQTLHCNTQIIAMSFSGTWQFELVSRRYDYISQELIPELGKMCLKEYQLFGRSYSQFLCLHRLHIIRRKLPEGLTNCGIY
jgi:hypothetical protein